jgi:hypothetical protein
MTKSGLLPPEDGLCAHIEEDLDGRDVCHGGYHHDKPLQICKSKRHESAERERSKCENWGQQTDSPCGDKPVRLHPDLVHGICIRATATHIDDRNTRLRFNSSKSYSKKRG